MSQTSTRMIPFEGVRPPPGNFSIVTNNSQEILTAIESLLGAATSAVQFGTEKENIKRREAMFEFRPGGTRQARSKRQR